MIIWNYSMRVMLSATLLFVALVDRTKYSTTVYLEIMADISSAANATLHLKQQLINMNGREYTVALKQ